MRRRLPFLALWASLIPFPASLEGSLSIRVLAVAAIVPEFR